jgi:hypothetical protein
MATARPPNTNAHASRRCPRQNRRPYGSNPPGSPNHRDPPSNPKKSPTNPERNAPTPTHQTPNARSCLLIARPFLRVDVGHRGGAPHLGGVRAAPRRATSSNARAAGNTFQHSGIERMGTGRHAAATQSCDLTKHLPAVRVASGVHRCGRRTPEVPALAQPHDETGGPENRCGDRRNGPSRWA